jgi:hypothetical protein
MGSGQLEEQGNNQYKILQRYILKLFFLSASKHKDPEKQ